MCGSSPILVTNRTFMGRAGPARALRQPPRRPRLQVSPQVDRIVRWVWLRNAVPVGLRGGPAREVPVLAPPTPLTSTGSLVREMDDQGRSRDSCPGASPAYRVVARCYGLLGR
jgi:hypothetical protein